MDVESEPGTEPDGCDDSEIFDLATGTPDTDDDEEWFDKDATLHESSFGITQSPLPSPDLVPEVLAPTWIDSHDAQATQPSGIQVQAGNATTLVQH